MNRYWGLGLSFLALGLLVYYFNDVLSWLILAWVVSLLGSPVMAFLGKLRIGSWQLSSTVRALIVLLGFYGLFGLFVYALTPAILTQARNLAGVDYVRILNSLDEPISRASDWLVEHQLMEREFSKYYWADNPLLAPNTNVPDSLRQDPNKLDEWVHGGGTPNPDKPQPKDSLEAKGDEPQSDSLVRENQVVDSNTVLNPVVAKDSAKSAPVVLQPEKDSFSDKGRFRQLSLNLDSLKKAEGQVLNIWVQVPMGDKEDKAPVIHEDSRSAFEALKKQVLSYFDISSLITGSVAYLLSILSNVLIIVTSVSFIAFFFLKDEELFGRGIKAAIPEKYKDEVDTALYKIKHLLTRYFGGILAQMSIITGFLWGTLTFMSIPNALLIAFFAALINVIPYIGPILGAVFAIIITLGSNVEADFYAHTLPMMLKVLGAFVAMQALDNFVLQPMIFSKSVLAHPLEIFIVVIVGAKLGGVTGMIVAIPLYTIFRVIGAVFLNEFHLVKSLTGHLGENIKTLPKKNGAEGAEPPPQT